MECVIAYSRWIADKFDESITEWKRDVEENFERRDLFLYTPTEAWHIALQ